MGDLLVLCYHGVSETWPAEEAVRPAHLERQLERFLRRGYRGATLSEALTTAGDGDRLVVTFDDAHRSVHELAAPILARLGLPATVFVPTGYAGTERPMAWDGYDEWTGTEHEGELLCMSWEQIGTLVDSGWEAGSHTRSHPRLSTLEEAEISAELEGSRGELEEALGRPCRALAYPYSDYDRRAVGAAGRAGYDFAVTVPRVPTRPLPLEWPRVGAFRDESPRRVALRARSRRLRPSAASRVALALKRLGR
jgi:peptidoglycan/xylan/chitin deacetylase (PgdA/CDA1 family)